MKLCVATIWALSAFVPYTSAQTQIKLGETTCLSFSTTDPPKMVCSDNYPASRGGKGTDWGKVKVITVALPVGYRVESVSFRLSGPHPCTADVAYPAPQNPKAEQTKNPRTEGSGSWAKCKEVSTGPNFVSWSFSFQGWTVETRSIDTVKGQPVIRWEL
jgi:hypothetical protein